VQQIIDSSGQYRVIEAIGKIPRSARCWRSASSPPREVIMDRLEDTGRLV
jgi:hypothetical protein